MYYKIRHRIYHIIEKAEPGDIPSKIFNIFIISLIFLNVVAIILESVKSISSNYAYIFYIFDVISVVIFSVEYVLRLWTCIVDNRYKGRIKGRIKYIFTPLALVDLFAVLPFYIPFIISIDLRFLRIIRLVRIFRIFKFGRYFDSLQTLGRVIRKKKAELLVTLFVVVLLLIIAASLIYEFEREAQPEKFSNIPESMWWAIITLTTVGYGDIYPVTILGKTLSAFIAILGIGLFALPAGIISSGMISELHDKKKKSKKCPHCGGIIDEESYND
ncbi:MAG: ion transporter [Actinobacteria bacterium]|nr:ion transporter [Actinomycetota bacterium]